MARFYDEILWNDITIDETGLFEHNISESVVFDVSDVAHNYYSNHHPDKKDPKDFNVIRPPYDDVWLEAKLSSAYRESMTPDLVGQDFPGFFNERVDQLSYYAALMSTVNVENEFDTLKEWFDEFPSLETSMLDKFMDGGAKWLINSLFVLDFADRNGVESPGIAWTFIDKRGQAVPVALQGESSKKFATMTIPNPAANTKFLSFAQAHMAPIYFSLSMLNCKNVTAEKNEPNESLAEKQKETKGRAQTTYRTLVVDVPNTIKSASGSGDGSSKKQHMVRGHFRTLESDYYTEEKQGESVWVPPHVRGSDDEGVVKKDYSVKTQKESNNG